MLRMLLSRFLGGGKHRRRGRRHGRRGSTGARVGAMVERFLRSR